MTLTGKESVYTIQPVVYVVVDDILKTNKQVIFLGANLLINGICRLRNAQISIL